MASLGLAYLCARTLKKKKRKASYRLKASSGQLQVSPAITARLDPAGGLSDSVTPCHALLSASYQHHPSVVHRTNSSWMGWSATLAAVAMAVGPPLAYSDQFVSIIRKRSSAGFSTDVPGVLLFANITRCFYWLGARFQLALLVQSLLMIAAQLALLYVCLLFREKRDVIDPRSLQETEGLHQPVSEEPISTSRVHHRPFKLWQWVSFGSYLECIAGLIAVHCLLFLTLHWIPFYVDLLGFVALGSEATLPIPQVLVNYERRSTAGFRYTVLIGWAGGDLIKTIYFFATENNGPAFKICALFQLSVDMLLCIQTWMYRAKTQRDLQSNSLLREEPGLAGTRGLYDVASPEDS
ncbi:BQ5605_C012g07028 [Microbotryum silenes-dioicae]|uniref:BQ5605_C012g07028 protein n=1 Tax=Microbotryum silenes-dioicae TaxID=796604 RepID=A0A2X0LT11_9BASI|nr:BQ5605_C012g07028 [Microbotryum silenes-dioicae]